MIVVANSGPLIALSSIHKLSLLHDLFVEIVVPQAVWNEVVVDGEGKAGSTDVSEQNWIKVSDVKNRLAVDWLRSSFGIGESEAIVLADEIKADLLLMDEARGRRLANRRGLCLVGTLGLLLTAKQKGLISTLSVLLEQLRGEGFYLSGSLYRSVLAQAGEEP